MSATFNGREYASDVAFTPAVKAVQEPLSKVSSKVANA